MQLSKTDRLSLINQYTILSRLDPDNKSHYEEIIEILQRATRFFIQSSMNGWQTKCQKKIATSFLQF